MWVQTLGLNKCLSPKMSEDVSVPTGPSLKRPWVCPENQGVRLLIHSQLAKRLKDAQSGWLPDMDNLEVSQNRATSSHHPNSSGIFTKQTIERAWGAPMTSWKTPIWIHLVLNITKHSGAFDLCPSNIISAHLSLWTVSAIEAKRISKKELWPQLTGRIATWKNL